MTIKFRSEIEKNMFALNFGFKYGSIFSMTVSISHTFQKEHIHGTISLHAFQLGGNPSALQNILSEGHHGQYYTLECNTQDMKDCTKAAKGLMTYAEKDFPAQFDLSKRANLTPLGLGWAEYQSI